MRLLVTGGAGYIGSVVSRHLLEAGHRVIIIDDLRAGQSSATPQGATLHAGSINDRKFLDGLLPGADGVLHFAGSIEVETSMRCPLSHFRNNVEGTITLLEAMAAHNVERLIFSSTAAIYGQPVESPVAEDHPLNPANPYGESKLMVERVLRWLAQQGNLRFATLRYFNAAGGPLPDRKAVNLIPIVLEVAAGRRPYVEIFGTDYPTRDGTAVRDYVHVEDLASGHLLALEALESNRSLSYNLGTGTGFTVREVIETARQVTDAPIPVVESPRRAGDPAEVVATAQKIRDELGWSPRYTDLHSIISSSWASYTGPS